MLSLSLAWLLIPGATISLALQPNHDARPTRPQDGQDTPANAAQDDDSAKTKIETVEIAVADGDLVFPVPKSWKKIEPKINFIEAELHLPPAEGDKKHGRLTIMGAGGSIEQNINRWKGQFVQPDGSDTSDQTQVEKKTVGDVTVHMVDIRGTFLESAGGPFGPKTERPNYRMLAAIIETGGHGNYFVKLYGPQKTIEAHAKAFRAMIDQFQLIE